jgi:hypothetical protein
MICSANARILAALVAACAFAVSASAEESPAATSVSVGFSGKYEANANITPSIRSEFGLSNLSKYFDVVVRFSANGDGKYGPELADIPGGNFSKFYVVMEEGRVGSRLGPVRLEGGRLKSSDAVDSPYSLFVNSGGIPANGLELAYDDGFFSYESRYIELNSGSTAHTDAYPDPGPGFPDRGAVVKTIAVRTGELRIGYQDVSVFLGRSFDAEYFLSPMPQYFTQYVKSTGGRPWEAGYDDNTIMGAFVEWRREGSFYLFAQALLDDFGLHFLFPSMNDNPWQAALSLGGRTETGMGSFGLYAAMATQYCFSPSQDAYPYGYSYYPETRFDIDRQAAGFQPAVLAIEDNEIGYKYGENNLAIQADWRGEASGFDLGFSLEFRLAGMNSPANPWGDIVNQPAGTRWLNDDVLEKRMLAGFSASRRIGNWRLYADLTAGVAFDALAIRASKDAYMVWLFEPVTGNTVPIFKLFAGAAYEWRLR